MRYKIYIKTGRWKHSWCLSATQRVSHIWNFCLYRDCFVKEYHRFRCNTTTQQRRTFCLSCIAGTLTDAFPSVFRVHGQHGNVASAEHLLVHVKLTHYGPDTLLLHHGLWNTQTNTQKVRSSERVPTAAQKPRCCVILPV